MVNVNDYKQEKSCTYKGEAYSVRDNGAVMRLTPEGKKARRLDNEWTFGKKNEKNGYMYIGSHRVHIIVATAFYGVMDSKTYVVDHIDTNRCNNRPENLRWLTRLENILLNDITRMKIEYICGSVESFLEDPSQLRGHEYEDKNFGWMRAVSKEEAENTLKNWKSLKENPRVKPIKREPIGEWIYENSSPFSSVSNGTTQTPKLNKEIERQDEKSDEEIRLQKEKEKAEQAEQKRKETQKRQASKQECINAVKESIVSIAKSHGWIVEKNVTGEGWKADIVIKSAERSIGFMLYKSTRNFIEKREAMRAVGIMDCWLGSTYRSYNNSEPFPCFDVEITQNTCVMAKMSEQVCVPLEELILAMMSNRLQVEDSIYANKIKVRFVSTDCYWCGYKHYIYFVLGVISDEGQSFSWNDYINCPDVSMDEFDPIVLNSVKRYLAEHPELNYPMGEIKERYSNTMNVNYMSFGCPKCDSLFGQFHYHDLFYEIIYEPDDENVHIIALEEPGLVIEHKHWVIVG